jgi:protein-tyrosine phosphatase
MIEDVRHPSSGGLYADGFGFEACFNFRDLGGYHSRYGAAVTRGRLFRSDSLHRMTARDAHVLAGLGIRTVLDLRADGERARDGGLRHGRVDLAVRAVPMADRAALAAPRAVTPSLAERAERYLRMARESATVIGAAMGVLADATAVPAVFHCAAGRDRTGVLAAVLLMILGVDDADIVTDYALTQRSKARTDEWVTRNEPATLEMWSRYPADLRTTYPHTMELFLARFRDEFGTVENYLADAGARTVWLDDLRFLMLE